MATHIGCPLFLALCLFGLMLRAAEANFPAIFVFGDSTLDVGNNDFLNRSKAKANFAHYGVDFPNSTPTGRFSNGYNTADQLAQLLGFRMSPPPFLSLTSSSSIIYQLSHGGISFASGGSGLLDQTGNALEAIPMSTQLQHFSSVVAVINAVAGPKRAASYLSRSLFFISTGSNDMFEYSEIPVGFGNDTRFLASLIDSYKCHLKTLYGLGARKFSIVSIPPLGCCPSQRIRNTTGGCYEELNNLSIQFYPMMDALLQEQQRDMPDMAYSLANGFEMVSFILRAPNTFNITELKVACCGSGQCGQDGCNSTAPMCPNRDKHLFWDAFHPTQAVSAIAAQTLYSGTPEFVQPVNVKQLAGM